jgi:hypothetical protein
VSPHYLSLLCEYLIEVLFKVESASGIFGIGINSETTVEKEFF